MAEEPGPAPGLPPHITEAVRDAALSLFDDAITASVDQVMKDRMAAMEEAIRASERERIRRGVLARELILQHPEDGDRVAVLALDLEQIIGAEDGSDG